MLEPGTLQKMPSCAIYGCRSGYTNEDKGYQAFKLPKSEELRNLWIEKINRSEYVATQFSIVCSKHFQEKDFVPDNENLDYRGRARKKKRLKVSAIPSLFLKPDIEISSRITKNSKKLAFEKVYVSEKKNENLFDNDNQPFNAINKNNKNAKAVIKTLDQTVKNVVKNMPLSNNMDENDPEFSIWPKKEVNPMNVVSEDAENIAELDNVLEPESEYINLQSHQSERGKSII